jgi:hypothetical protein
MVFHYTVGKENAILTAQHFAISRKTFHKWFKRLKSSKYNVQSLADQSKAPCHKRNREVTLTQEERIRRLRKRYPYYGKKKLKVLYELVCSRKLRWDKPIPYESRITNGWLTAMRTSLRLYSVIFRVYCIYP